MDGDGGARWPDPRRRPLFQVRGHGAGECGVEDRVGDVVFESGGPLEDEVGRMGIDQRGGGSRRRSIAAGATGAGLRLCLLGGLAGGHALVVDEQRRAEQQEGGADPHGACALGRCESGAAEGAEDEGQNDRAELAGAASRLGVVISERSVGALAAVRRLPVVIAVAYGVSTRVRNVETCADAVNASRMITRLLRVLCGTNPTTRSISIAARAGLRTSVATLGRSSDSAVMTPATDAMIAGTWLRAALRPPPTRAGSTPSRTACQVGSWSG